MWTRAELKSRAKANLSRYYGPALFVSFIAGLFTSSGGSSAGTSAGTVDGVGSAASVGNLASEIKGSFDSIISDPNFLGVIASIIVVIAVIGLALTIFVAPVLKVGKNRFYMESRETGESAGAGMLLWGLKHGYLNIIWTMFLKNLFVILGTCCCIVPGFYFSYCYYMVPYILAENPDMKAMDAMRLSKEMMEGQKWNTFILEVSFWGWWLLGSLACGIGGIFIQPYFDATIAELYAELRQKFQYELNGFGYRNDGESCYYGNGGWQDGSQQWTDSARDAYQGEREESGTQNDAESSRDADYGYYQRTAEWTDVNRSGETVVQPPVQTERGQEVKRSEGGPGRGYYLNGVFYPYTEDELRELEDNRHKN